MAKKTMLLLFNPKAGRGEFPLNLFEVVDKFTKEGFVVTVYPTQASREAYNIVLGRGGDYDYLVCSGGDGTLNEVVDALMHSEHHPVFGYIPSGSTNDFASSLGLPKDILEAASVVTDGVARALDIGKFQEDYFSYVAAFGLFTDVSYDTSQDMKNSLGHLAYVLEGVKRLGAIQSYRCVIDLGDKEISGNFIFGMVTNSLSVGGFKLPSENPVKMDDGLFEVALLKKPSSFIDLQNVIASLLNQELYTKSLILCRAKKVTVRSQKPLSWTVDGEFGGEYKEVTIENIPKAIEIMMPRADNSVLIDVAPEQ